MAVNWTLVDLVREGPVTRILPNGFEIDARLLLEGQTEQEHAYKRATRGDEQRAVYQMVINELGARLKVITMAYPEAPAQSPEYDAWERQLTEWLIRHRTPTGVETAILSVKYHDVMR